MLSFLNSIMLPALLAVGIPILIHLFSRQKTKKVLFSSVRFLKLLENSRIRQVRLYQILLIIIRSLFILFLVLAFARPTLKDAVFGGASAARTSVVIMLDDSYSMQSFLPGGSAMDKGKALAEKIVNASGAEDQIYLLPASQADNPIDFTKNRDEALRSLKRLQASNLKPSFTSMLQRAVKLFRSYPNYNREVYLISDFKINTNQLKIQPAKRIDSVSTLQYLVPVNGKTTLQNISIDTAFIANRLFEINQPVKVHVRLTNYGSSAIAETAVHLFAGEKRMAMQRLRINAGETAQVDLSYIPERSGWQFLKIEIDEDDLLRDNFYFLSFRLPAKVKVLFADDAGNSELNAALRVISQNSSLRIEQYGYNRLYGLALAGYDLIILNDPPQLSLQLTDRLRSFLAGGKNLFIITGERLMPTDFNRQFQNLFERNIIKDLKKAEKGGFYMLHKNMGKQPLFSAVFRDEQSEPALPHFFRYYKIAFPDQQLLSFDNQDAFLAVYKAKNLTGRIFLASASLNIRWTDLPLQGFFVPMLHRILLAAAHREQQALQTLVGRSIAISFSDIQADKKYDLQDPDGEIFPLLAETRFGNLRFFIKSPSKPGHYKIMNGDFTVGAFAVNVASGELAGPFIDWSKIWPNHITLQAGDDFNTQIRKARKGREIWRLFIILALSMLIMEMLIVRRLEGKKT